MARFGFTASRVPSTTLSTALAVAAAASMRRAQIYELVIGCPNTPSDVSNQWQMQFATTAGTGSAITPFSLDQADTLASTIVAKGTITIDPTLTANAIPLDIGLNQKATFRWVAAPGSELIIPATASNGYALRTPIAGSTVACDATIMYNEL
jgi:hypothetical protein